MVTGSNGFVGKSLCNYLSLKNFAVHRAVRAKSKDNQENIFAVGDIGGTTDWRDALSGVDTIVHLAARVHVMADSSSDPLGAFREVNVDGTLNLARQAVATKVRRFIFLSSIKVNGEETFGHPFTEEDNGAPHDPYGQSKFEAEKGLTEIARETGLEVVIVRPPLVYGPEVKANFLRLLCWVKKGVPLPLGRVNNRRSFIFLDNLVDFLATCIDHPAAVGETFLVADGEDLSISELIKSIALHMNLPVRLIPVPVVLLSVVGRLLGKSAEVHRLCGSLQVDVSKAKKVLDWRPPSSFDEGLKKTVSWYLSKN